MGRFQGTSLLDGSAMGAPSHGTQGKTWPGCIRTVGIKRLAVNRSPFCIDARQVEVPLETIVYSLVWSVLLRTRSSSKIVGRKGERDLGASLNAA